MKIAVFGGGLTGLTAAHYLSQKKHRVTVFEKEKNLGGLAAGFKTDQWGWFLERTIHHLFSNDGDILNFAKKIGFDKIFFQEPVTASLYKSEIRNPKIQINPKSENINTKHLDIKNSNLFRASDLEFRIFPLDTPIDLLKFPLLSFPGKIRAGIMLVLLKLSPPLSLYEKTTAMEFLNKYMGKKAADTLFGELFRKKLGKYAENILTSFIWARIKKRTKKLGYIEGGFQTLVNYLEKRLIDSQVNILKGYEIKTIEKKEEKFLVSGEEFDAVISTLPTPVLVKIGEKMFPQSYLEKLNKIKFLHAVSLVIETDGPILDKAYWLNICTPDLPLMGLFQQTNFIDKKNYGGKHILYCGWYVGFDDKLWKMSEREILDFALPYLNKIANFQFPISKQTSISKQQISNFHVFKAPFAQPIFDRDFLKNKPEFVTPIKNFYIANMDMTYPYDRGTNYAVKLGKEAAELL